VLPTAHHESVRQLDSLRIARRIRIIIISYYGPVNPKPKVAFHSDMEGVGRDSGWGGP
jgi:hypothetical protein